MKAVSTPNLWSGTGNFVGNVVLNFTTYPKGEFQVYAAAYHEAARAVVRSLVSGQIRRIDVYACPALFLYRHSLELYLKAIVFWGAGLLRLHGEPPRGRNRLFETHKLSELVGASRPIFRELNWLEEWHDPDLNSFESFARMVSELEKIDPGSYAFRYPVGKGGNASIPAQFCFNIAAVGERFDRLLKLLDGAATGVYEIFQEEAAIARDLRP